MRLTNYGNEAGNEKDTSPREPLVNIILYYLAVQMTVIADVVKLIFNRNCANNWITWRGSCFILIEYHGKANFV